MAIKLCRHGEVVHKTTSLQRFRNFGFTVKGQVNNIDMVV